ELWEDNCGNDWSIYSRGFGGETPLAPIQGITNANIPGLQGTSTTGNNVAMRGLLSLMTGSLARVTQLYWIGSAQRLDQWDDWRGFQLRARTLNQKEDLAFFKDDLEIKREVTRNLCVGWG